MVITVFRSRLKPGIEDEYERWSERIGALAETMPGFISARDYVAPDGERVAIVEFESAETQRAWAQHPQHVEAQQKGRRDFYSEYRIQVCTVEREHRFP
jgi:heme-degrading monooxygenase HmoA